MCFRRFIRAGVFSFACFIAHDAIAQISDDQFPGFAAGFQFSTPEQRSIYPETPIFRDFLPERVDLSGLMPRPGNQGKQPSCVGWTVGYATRAYYAAREGRDIDDRNNVPSPAYIYNMIQKRTPDGACSTTIFIDAFRLLYQGGAPSMAQYPYTDAHCNLPAEAIREKATDFRIADIFRIDPTKLDQIKGQIARGNPVMIGMKVSPAFERLKPGEIYSKPDGDLGGHAITVVGYDERRQAFKLLNSWGKAWSQAGYGWIGYDAFKTEVREAYVMLVANPKPQPEPKPPVVAGPPKPSPQPNPNPPAVTPAPQPSPNPPVVSPTPQPVPTPPQTAQACALVKKDEAGGKPILTGFVGTDAQLENLKKENPNADIRVDVRPWPQCETLLTLDRHLQRTDSAKVQIRKREGNALVGGDPLEMLVATPPYPAYIHVAYIQADGSVLNLVQPLSVMPANEKITLGTGSAAEGGVKFKVSPPYGREMLVVLTGRAPIFPEARPKQETEREFLTALRTALIAKLDPGAPDRDIAASFDTVVTKER